MNQYEQLWEFGRWSLGFQSINLISFSLQYLPQPHLPCRIMLKSRVETNHGHQSQFFQHNSLRRRLFTYTEPQPCCLSQWLKIAWSTNHMTSPVQSDIDNATANLAYFRVAQVWDEVIWRKTSEDYILYTCNIHAVFKVESHVPIGPNRHNVNYIRITPALRRWTMMNTANQQILSWRS